MSTARHLKRKTLYDDDNNPTVQTLSDAFENDIKPLLGKMQREIMESQDEVPNLTSRNLERFKDDHSSWLQTKSDEIAALDHSLKKYVSKWIMVASSLQTESLQQQTNIRTTETRTEALRDDIRQLSDAMRRQKSEFDERQNDYEKHIKILESALAQTQPKSIASNTLQKLNDLNIDASDELAKLQNELQDHVRQSKEYEIKNEALMRNQQIMRKNPDELQKQLLEYSEDLRRKDSEITKLRFVIQDLQMERNELEHKIREYDNGFISKTPNQHKGDPYHLDLSEFNDDDDDVTQTDAATRGFLELELSSDTEISRETQDALKKALEAAKEVTDFARERDETARRLEAQMDNNVGGGFVLEGAKEYRQRWINYKSELENEMDVLQDAQKRCTSIKRVLTQIKPGMFNNISENQLAMTMSVLQSRSEDTDEIHLTLNEAKSEFENLRAFIDKLFDESSKYDGKAIVAIDPKTQVIIDKTELDNMSRNVARTDDENNENDDDKEIVVEPLDPESHRRRREEYKQVIDDLDQEIRKSSEACEQIAIQLEDAVAQLSGSNASTVDNLGVLSPIQQYINEELDNVQETLINTLKELTMAGKLLMQNDKLIERYQNELNILSGSLKDTRSKYHNDVEDYQLNIRKLRDRETQLKEQLQTERGITERRTKEVKRFETENKNLSKRLQEHNELSNPKEFANIFQTINNLRTKIRNGYTQGNDLLDLVDIIQKLVTTKMEEYDLTQQSEHELRFRANEAARQLEDSKMRREFDKANWKRKNELLKNGFDHEKALIENRHNEELERLQDENQLLRATNGDSQFDIQIAIEQMEDALHEAHIQLRDKDDEISELKDALAQYSQEISDYQRETSNLRMKNAGAGQGTDYTDNILYDDNDNDDEYDQNGMSMTNSMSQRIDYERHAKEIMDMLSKTVTDVLSKASVNTGNNFNNINDNNDDSGIINNNRSHVYNSSNTTYGISNSFAYTNGHNTTNPNAYSMEQSDKEVKVLLQRLEDEIEVLSTFVNERDRAIELLSNRLGVIKIAHKSISDKYQSLRGKYLKDDDDSDVEQQYGVGDEKPIREDGSDISELEKSAGQFDGLDSHRKSDNLLAPPMGARESFGTGNNGMLGVGTDGINPADISRIDNEQRRRSVAQVSEMLEQAHRHAMQKKPQNALQSEVKKRKSNSHRRSSLTKLDLAGFQQDRLAAPHGDDYDGNVPKSDLGKFDPQSKMTEDDKEQWRQMALSIPKFLPRRSKIEDTPANSPTRTPSDHGSIIDETDDPKMQSMEQTMKEHRNEHKENDNNNSNNNINNINNMTTLNNASASQVLEDIESYKRKIADMQDVLYRKEQLIEDLDLQIEAIRQKRASEVKLIEARLDTMKKKVRDWYDNLIERVAYMEEFVLSTTQGGISSQETKDELERLRQRNEELTTQSFASHKKVMEKKIELENLQEEFTKASLEIQELKEKLTDAQQSGQQGTVVDENIGANGSVNIKDYEKLRMANDQLREDTQQLKKMLHDQEEEYEREFKDFENMANNKVADLETFYKGTMTDLEKQFSVSVNANGELRNEISELRNNYGKLQMEYDKLAKSTKEDSNESMVKTTEEKESKLDDVGKGDGKTVSRAKYDKLHKKLEKCKTMISELATQSEKELKKIEEQWTKKHNKTLKKCEKYQKKADDMKFKNRQLKSDLKMSNLEIIELKEANDSLKSVFGEMLHLKGILKQYQSEAQIAAEQHEQTIKALRDDIQDLRNAKIEHIKQTMVEMNNLRDIIKELQRRLQQKDHKIQMLSEGHTAKDNALETASVASGTSNFLSLRFWK